MWNKLSLQLRVTLSGAVCLLSVCVLLVSYLVVSAGNTFYVPYVNAVQAVAAVEATEEGLPMPDAERWLPGQASTQEFVDAEYRTAQDHYLFTSVCVAVLLTLVGIGAIWLVSGRAIRTVSNLSRQIEAVDESRLNAPLPVPEAADEVRRLTVSFNRMLARVGSSYEAQKRFAHNAAHELKTPVANMLTVIEVSELDDDSSAEELRETITEVKAEVLRLKELIGDMMSLNVSKVEKHPVDFQSLCEEIIRELEPDCTEKDISIFCEGNTVLQGDQALLKRAFANLLQNAVRYNIPGGTVTVHCERDKITVTDTGIGIPPEHLGHILEPFYCADPSRSRSLGGSGLGLSIVKQILDKHDMPLEIQSNSSGTTVTVRTNSN